MHASRFSLDHIFLNSEYIENYGRNSQANMIGTPSVCDFKFNDHNTKWLAEGKRQLTFPDFGAADLMPKKLTFKNAHGLLYLDFFLPSTSTTFYAHSPTAIECGSSLKDMQIDFVRAGWKHDSDPDWHVEPCRGWSFEISIECKKKMEETTPKQNHHACPKCGIEMALGSSVHKCRNCNIFVCCGAEMQGWYDGFSAKHACAVCHLVLVYDPMRGYQRFPYAGSNLFFIGR